jgi:hypothetical protein
VRGKLKEDVVTEKQILIKQKQNSAARRTPVFVAEDADIGIVCESIVGQSGLEDFRALIDMDHILRHIMGRPFCRRCWRGLNEKLGT